MVELIIVPDTVGLLVAIILVGMFLAVPASVPRVVLLTVGRRLESDDCGAREMRLLPVPPTVGRVDIVGVVGINEGEEDIEALGEPGEMACI